MISVSLPSNRTYKEENNIKLDGLLSGIDGKEDILRTGEDEIRTVTLTKTTIEEDLGQTTIPFFDTQPLRSSMSVVQSGVGLYHR